MTDVTPMQRFLEKVRISRASRYRDLPCVEWTGGKDRNGYGKFQFEGRVQEAHRVAYILFVGPIAPGLVVDHLCRNPGCVHPAHLEPVSHRENLMRGMGPERTRARYIGPTCVHGHPWADNAYFAPGNPTKRLCRACRADQQRRDRARRRAVR